MAKKNSERPSDMDNLVKGFDSILKDPKAHAEGTYARQIKNQGRPWGGERDARTKANKPWNKNGIPV